MRFVLAQETPGDQDQFYFISQTKLQLEFAYLTISKLYCLPIHFCNFKTFGQQLTNRRYSVGSSLTT